MIKRLAGIAAAVLSVVNVTQATETTQHYPDRPVMLMVSYGAGGATDFQARIVTMTAGNQDALGMPIAIINKPGAGGRVGWNWLATRAKTDGYILGAYNVPHFIAQSVKGGVNYSIDSFEPIANWGADPAVFIVPADSPFKTMADVLNWAREHPGKLTFSGAGLFVGHHIAALQIEKAAGVKMAYIPNKSGGAGAMKAVIAGEVMAGVNNLS
ncbi:MAG: tripartite tricarboxylate transporter substrate binding protein, partial [Pseudomonadota bacterium]